MKDLKPTLLLGAHVSIAGGYENAVERAESIGCTAFQIFTKSNRQWAAKKISPTEAETFMQALQKSSTIKSVVAHATYLINLASADDTILKRSIAALKEELHRCDLLGIPLLILHPGSAVDSSKEEGMLRVSSALNIVLESYKGKATIALETMAGQGSVIGSTFEELATIRSNLTSRDRVSVCLDTCHVLSAGYSLETTSDYDALWKNFDDIIGLDNLSCFHINDSKRECGSRVDRHEHIGKGKIGIGSFALIMNDERFIDIPKILETPKESLKDDAINMQILKNLLSSDMRKKYGI